MIVDRAGAGLRRERTRLARHRHAVGVRGGRGPGDAERPEPGVARLAAGAAIVLAVVIGLAGLIQIAPARQEAQFAASYPVATRRLARRPRLPRPPPQRLRLGRLPDRGLDGTRRDLRPIARATS